MAFKFIDEQTFEKNYNLEEFNEENRDQQHINSHLLVRWDDLIAEPDGIRSAKCIWKCSYRTYRATKWFWYNVLTAIFFIPAAFIWGIKFGCLSFMHIWCWGPFNKGMQMNWYIMRTLISMIIETTVSPIMYSVGLILSRIRVSHYQENGSENKHAPALGLHDV